MTLRKVNLSLAFKIQLKLAKAPGVLTSFTDNIVVNTEICKTSKLIPQKYTYNHT